LDDSWRDRARKNRHRARLSSFGRSSAGERGTANVGLAKFDDYGSLTGRAWAVGQEPAGAEPDITPRWSRIAPAEQLLPSRTAGKPRQLYKWAGFCNLRLVTERPVSSGF
jgi:hypothetical protein